MRLIDADELKENMVRECRKIGKAMGVTMPVLVFTHVIDNAPTIEERPKGKWIIDGHHIRCNRCNEYICNTDNECNEIPDNFCPNCGADMRKEDPRESD